MERQCPDSISNSPKDEEGRSHYAFALSKRTLARRRDLIEEGINPRCGNCGLLQTERHHNNGNGCDFQKRETFAETR
jgi:hypothetical protein